MVKNNSKEKRGKETAVACMCSSRKQEYLQRRANLSESVRFLLFLPSLFSDFLISGTRRPMKQCGTAHCDSFVLVVVGSNCWQSLACLFRCGVAITTGCLTQRKAKILNGSCKDGKPTASR